MRPERFLRSVSVRTRLLAALLCVSIIPTVFVGLYANRAYTQSIAGKLADSAVQTIQLLDDKLATNLQHYTRFIDAVSVSPEVQDMLVAGRGGMALRRLVSDTVTNDYYFHGIRVVGTDGTTLYDAGYARISESEFGDLLRGADAASPADSLYHIGGSRSGNLTIGRKIFRYPLGQEHIGYIFAFIDDTLLNNKEFNNVSFGGGGVTLLSAGGTVLADGITAPGTPLAGTPLYTELLDAAAAGEESFLSVTDEVPSLVVFSRNKQYDTYMLAAIPLSYINEGTGQASRSMIVFAAVTAILCVVLSIWIYSSVASPINKIVAKCRDGGTIGDKSPDELGFLAQTIDQYTVDLEAMTQARVADQRRKRELELDALQYQINPHFLFNTLGTLKWVAVINDAAPIISEGITSLSQLLRNVLLNRDEMITVREELDILAYYFSIQKIRYADCFEVVNEIDETVLDSKIPRFILQPLAENAILHGSQRGGRRIAITVHCERTAEGVLLEIRDDGNGFDPEAVKNSSEGRFSGIGLTNVDERLKLYFGEDHGLVVHSKPGEGTVCRVLVPDAPKIQGGDGND